MITIPILRSKLMLGIFFIGSLLLMFTVLFLGIYYFPIVIHNEVDKIVRLDEGNEQWDRFLNLPFPLSFDVYLFEIENPEEISKGEKPRLQERGPYIYRQSRKKNLYGMDDNDDTVSYKQIEHFEFDGEASYPLKDTDNITMLNVAYWAIIQDDEVSVKQGGVSYCIDKLFPGGVFTTRPVREFLFDGINFCNKDLGFICNYVCSIIKDKHLKNIEYLGDDGLIFSYFRYKNNVDDGLYRVKRGRDNIKELGSITRWNETTDTNFWVNSTNNITVCDHVRGTDATIYPPRVLKDTVFTIYATDICRSVDIYFKKEQTYKGINGYQYMALNTTLYSPDPESSCFCAKLTYNANEERECYLDGILDIRPCIGASVLLSFPHFLYADEKYINGIEGLEPPDEDKHGIMLNVEPNTGIPLEGHKRVQLNAVLRYTEKIEKTTNFPRAILPLLWLDEGIELPQKYVDELNEEYFNKVHLIDGLKYGFIGLFALQALIFGSLFIRALFCLH